MRAPLVRIIVLNYQGGEHVLRCLESLALLEWPADRLQVVVVDNASTDGSAEEIARRFPHVDLRRQATNTGFPANNVALVDLDGVDLVALLNNDATVEPGWLTPLVDAMEQDPTLGAACPKILFAHRYLDVVIGSTTYRPGGGDPRELGVRLEGVTVDGVDRWADLQLGQGLHGIEPGPDGPFSWTAARAVVRVPVDDESGPHRVALRLRSDRPTTVTVDGRDGPVTADVGTTPTTLEVVVDGPRRDVINNVGSRVLPDGSGADRGFLEVDEGQHDEPTDVFAWCGGSVLLRPAYLRSVGMFEERFFLYYEDTDLSWRGQAQGWRYRTVPASVCRHLHATSTGEGSPVFQHYVERNRLLMLTRNAPPGLAAGAAVRHLLATASYARRDVVRPLLRGRRPSTTLVRRRLRSWLAWAQLLPWALASRAGLRRRQIVPDADLASRMDPPTPARVS
ncbi:glycosyltransferase [Actinomarinicola tropica]|uniref:glycosyltransferase n=1 Tax=Actinomarinicola tropica TaxID=2789776 RepID=UPI001899BC73|nr:glycosyltransferase [Actinomarinicola tropica]